MSNKAPLETDDTHVQAIARLVAAQLESESIDGTPFIVVGNDQHVEDLSRFSEFPARKKGLFAFSRCESFTRFVNEHKTNLSRVYVPNPQCIIAVINHAGGATDGADWGDFRAQYNTVHSPEWMAWTRNDKAKKTQKEFCEFIEDNGKDISDRTDMLELVRTLQIESQVDFKTYEKGDNNNTSLQFTRTSTTKAGQKGEVELPDRFEIKIQCFDGGPVLPIAAKLRFEINEGKLKLWYELQQVQRILTQHTELVVAEIEKATAIKPFYGTPA